MLVQRRVMTWRSVAKSLQTLVAHASLFTFTILLVLKLHRSVRYSWWIILSPLWLFHVVVARGRFSLPAPKLPNDRNLMCKALMPGDDEHVNDDVIWETLPHFWISISMVFFLAATVFTLLKINGDISALGWWDLFINFGIAQGFAFLVCTKWYNPAIHRHAHIQEPCSSSMSVRYLDWNSGLVVSSDDDQDETVVCSLQDIGGHIMKIPLIIFQILLFMHLEGRPSAARHIPVPVLFAPLLLVQGTGLLFSAYRLTEKIVLLVHDGVFSVRYLDIASKVREYFGFYRHGSRLLGWWSIDERSREEQARLCCAEASGYNTFSPDIVKKLPRSDLVEEIWKLQAALSEQTEIMKFSQQEYERLQTVMLQQRRLIL